MKVLLVEPNYKNKYPPMGLMKISTYHKLLGDEVRFVKGYNSEVDEQVWDRIYITSLFTFDFKITVETINHYIGIVDHTDSLYVGGILASLMPKKIAESTGIDGSHILRGLFTDTSTVGDDNDINVDELPLDYDILEDTEYVYATGDNYLAFTTRGCPNKCPFCAVPTLEPQFCITNNIVQQINTINERYGPKKDLLLLDNNVLNTPNLKELVDDLCSLGFEKGSKFVDPGAYCVVMMRYKRGERALFLDKKLYKYLCSFKKRIKSDEALDTFLDIMIAAETQDDFAKFMLSKEEVLAPIVEKYRNKMPRARHLDFNQGIDARRINDENMSELSRLCIHPLRIAFDDIRMKDTYCNAVRTACRHGISGISNYILFNYNDKPEDLYERLRANIELNEELGIQIFSFPMKYSPVDRTDRNYVGKHWTMKALRAVSAILQVTHGAVAAGSDFFFKAFGGTIEEYLELLAMPRNMIMFRSYFESNGITAKWKSLYLAMSECQKEELMRLASHTVTELRAMSWPSELEQILPYYLIKQPSAVSLTELKKRQEST